MTDKPYFTPPLTVPEKVCDVWIIFHDNIWSCTIEPPNGCRSVVWTMKEGDRPGALLNRALKWAKDRGLDMNFVTANITKQVPREETE